MSKFCFEITIEAPSEREAELKLRSASTLIQKLATTELGRLADIVRNDPLKTAMARKALGL